MKELVKVKWENLMEGGMMEVKYDESKQYMGGIEHAIAESGRFVAQVEVWVYKNFKEQIIKLWKDESGNYYKFDTAKSDCVESSGIIYGDIYMRRWNGNILRVEREYNLKEEK